MSKRFTDTDKWRKGFIRSLEAPYKILYLYILDECDHAGIWHVELDVACVRIGFDIQSKEALEVLGNRIYPFDDGEKWFIPDFIPFQYGDLNESNRVHLSVIRQLTKYGLKDLISPFQGAKDKDKGKDKAKGKKKPIPYTVEFESIWAVYPPRKGKKTGKQEAMVAWVALGGYAPLPSELIEILEKQKQSQDWQYDNGAKIPDMHRWLSKRRWDDEIDLSQPSQSNMSGFQYDGLTAQERKIKRQHEVLSRDEEG